MTTYLTQGTWLIKSTTAPTSSYDLDGKTAGVDYIRLTNRPIPTLNVQIEHGVFPIPGGTQFAVSIGQFSGQFTIDDIADETRNETVEKFIFTHAQPATANQLYIVRVTANGSPPTLKNWYKSSATAYAYLPVRLSGFTNPYSEEDLHYKIRIACEVCWTS
jgi:hypothetical protein